MHRIVVVGCGQVVRDRILPAMAALHEEGLFSVDHVVDVLPHEQVAGVLDQLLPAQRPVYHQIRGVRGELACLLQRDELRTLPVVVATPTPFHAEHACAALAVGCPVALEKPLAANLSELDEIASCLKRSDAPLLFPLGYYLIEKGLPLLALARRGVLTSTQLSCLGGIAPADWRKLRDRLGAVSSVTALLREGDDPRTWVLSDTAGGHTLETFSHLIAMVLPWLEPLTLKEAVLGKSSSALGGPTENLIYAEFEGPNRETVRLGCEKWCPPGLSDRWLSVECEHGSVHMDLESQHLTIRLRDERRNAFVSTRVKYEPQLRMFAAKLDNPDEPTEYDAGRRTVLLSLAVRELGLKGGLATLPSAWLDVRLKREKHNG